MFTISLRFNTYYTPLISAARPLQMAAKLLLLILISATLAFQTATAASASAPRAPTLIDFIGTYAPADMYITDIALGPDGKVHAIDFLHEHARIFDEQGTLLFTIKDASLGKPRRISVDEAGNIYISYHLSNIIVKYDASGTKLATYDIFTGDAGFATRFGKLAVTTLLKDSVPAVYDLETGTQLFELDNFAHNRPKFKRPGDIAILSNGHILVADRETLRIERFDERGRFVEGFRLRRGSQPGEITNLHSMAVDSKGRIIISDRLSSRISVFSPKGQFITQWGEPGKGPGKFQQQLGISTGPDDTIWVAGYHAHDIQRFSPDGQLIDRWVGRESGPGEFAFAEGVASAGDKIFIADRFNQRIQVFDRSSRQYLYEFGERGDTDATVFNFPRALTVDADGYLYVTDYLRVRKLTQSGDFIRSYPYSPAIGEDGLQYFKLGSQGICVNAHGAILWVDRNNNTVDRRRISSGDSLPSWPIASSTKPYGIAFSPQQHVYVTDQAAKTVTRYSQTGEFQYAWTTPKSPSGIAIDHTRKIIYVGAWNTIYGYSLQGRLLFEFDGRNSEQKNRGGVMFGHLFVDQEGVLYASDMLGTINLYRHID